MDIESLRSVFESTNNQRLSLKAQSPQFIRAVSTITKHIDAVLPNAKPVRLVTFNKSKSENWAVSWHQDRIISVGQKISVDGYTNWSRKTGLWHCEPPSTILKNMLAVRIHLDDADTQTGALELLKASHKFGKVTANQIEGVIERCEPMDCHAKTGDILIMKMLMLHRSRPSLREAPRRAIRIDYSADILPMPLRWETGTNCVLPN